MDISVDQPIAALASPAGGAARGIIRISGRDVQCIVSGWFIPDNAERWQTTRRAESHSGTIRLNGGSRPLEIPAQALFWPNHRSYTGQALIELHLPGSPPLLEAVLEKACRHGARSARPGEFTLRAFLAGKLDLLQAEAVLGVIDARDHIELQTALAQLAGGVSGRLGLLRSDLLELLADLEAGLDFVDEDIEFVSRDDVIDRLEVARIQIDELLQQTADRMQSRVRPQVVLAGLPNAGKSTLFNRLAGADSALVSPEQGTTRDFLIRRIEWDGVSFDLIDTAGWDDRASGIEASAQWQRNDQLQRADLLIWCTSSTLDESERTMDQQLFEQSERSVSAALRLFTKVDLARSQAGTAIEGTGISISAVSDIDLAVLESRIRTLLSANHTQASQWLGMTAARCRETLESVADALDRSERAARVLQTGDELIAVDLREALDRLGVILGAIYTDDILDRVFSKFCIGK